ESRAVHQPLPTRPRRDRRLPGRRPPFHQRHAPLAVAEDVRRLVLAHRRPVWSAAAPPRGHRHPASRRDPPPAGRAPAGRKPDAGQDRHRRRRRAVPLDERASTGLRAREAPLRRHLVLVVPRRAEDRHGRYEAEAGAREEEKEAAASAHDDGYDDYDYDNADDRLVALSLFSPDRLDQPSRYARRTQRPRIGAGVARGTFGDQLAAALHQV